MRATVFGFQIIESRDKQCLWKHGQFVYNYQICTMWEMSVI